MFVRPYRTPNPTLAHDGALESWTNSRPTETDPDFDSIMGLDLPVTEFTPINLFIESSILEREIIATMRGHIMWAQSSRIQDAREFTLDADVDPELNNWRSVYASMREHMVNLSASDRQDEWRLGLPVMSNTRYSISTNLRSIIKLAKYFEYLAEVTVLSDRFNAFAQDLFWVAESCGMKRDHISAYHRYNILSESWESNIIGSCSFNGVHTITETIPLHLRAHIVRHRGVGFSDTLFQALCSPDIYRETISSLNVDATIHGTDAELSEIVAKRSCWIAHYGVWAGLLSEIEDCMTSSGSFLPCKDGKCPFDADVRLRTQGKDPNPPCPIHCTLNHIIPSTSQVADMYGMVLADKRSEEFWNPQIQNLDSKL